MKRKNVIFTEMEWKILRVLWDKGRASVKEVWQIGFPNQERALTTVQTYMDRMRAKGVLSREKSGMINYYFPLLSEEEALKMATESLVKRAFHGSFGSLAAFLINSRQIKSKDLEKIKRLIQENEEK